MAVTLQDVARLAGVSVGTASQALNQNPKVNSDTMRRVLDAAQTLGYVVKSRRKPLSADRSLFVVGVLSKHDVGHPMLTNPFYTPICAGIEQECRKNGLSLMLSTIEVDLQNRPVEWPVMLDSRLVDGLIFIGAQVEEIADAIGKRLQVPTLLIDSYAPTMPFDTVITDSFHGATMAMEHLLGLGHRAIGLIGSKQQSVPSIAERRTAYSEALERRGLFHPRYIENSELERYAAQRATTALLQRCPEITAIFACNDETAAGAITAARELGRRVPADLSVVGFDDIALATEHSPPLTTVHVYKSFMGALAVRALLERAADPDRPRTVTRVATRLIVRGSTAPPPVAAAEAS
jgi:LacI family transcriptional regulator